MVLLYLPWVFRNNARCCAIVVGKRERETLALLIGLLKYWDNMFGERERVISLAYRVAHIWDNMFGGERERHWLGL